VLRRCIASIVLVLTLVACGGAHLDPKVAKRLAVAKASKSPAYWLGPRYDGLDLVYVESGDEAFFKSSLYYADCSQFDLQTLSPHCHRIVEVDNDVPAPGEISTMGRCIFSTDVHGITVATFPVNPGDLRVFSRGATILVSARRRSESLQAIAALQPLNGRPLAHRDVSAALGTCKPPPPKPLVRLSAKERYERRMKHSFFIESVGGLNLNRVTVALVRNEADRIEKIKPPAAVAALHARLVTELRAYAAAPTAAAVSAITRTVKAFQARGYSIFVKPTD